MSAFSIKLLICKIFDIHPKPKTVFNVCGGSDYMYGKCVSCNRLIKRKNGKWKVSKKKEIESDISNDIRLLKKRNFF